ncbi:TPA: hypothetical protein NH891_001878 [Pseudomonas aeruginosa]|nr:hypothetical protein [Pseudomonas aeruginosa]
MSKELNKALDLLREIRPSIPKDVLELWCKDRDAFLAQRSEFHQHLKECADEVATWPTYKREALGPFLGHELGIEGETETANELNKAPVEQAGGDERTAFEAAFAAMGRPVCRADYDQDAYGTPFDDGGWTGWQARAALAQPSPKCATCNDSGQIVVSGPHYQGEFQPPEYETEPCDMCAQPSPAQAEQAEAERPEVVGYLATAEHPKHGQPHKAFNYFKDQHDAQVAHWRERGCEVSDDELMTVAQHGRIVGALRARNEKLEADAGALEWLRSTFKVHKAIVEQAGCGTIEQLAEQRDAANSRLHEVSVACATAEQERDAALARIAELEAALSSALSQHGVKFMDPPDGGDTPLIEQVCRMSQALSELEKQEPVGEVRESGGTLTAVIVRHSYATKLPVGTKLYAAPVSQAQRSVPEEFSFEYRHPNGECHTVTVSREQVINEMPDFLFEALCSKLCNCEPVGETNVVECRCDEYAEEFKLIAAAPGNEGV